MLFVFVGLLFVFYWCLGGVSVGVLVVFAWCILVFLVLNWRRAGGARLVWCWVVCCGGWVVVQSSHPINANVGAPPNHGLRDEFEVPIG